jgi:uncharacterized protein YpuA (DUF1002 family)
MKEEITLDNLTLVTTCNELLKVGHLELVQKIQSILRTSELPKPDRHNRKDDKTTSYYKVELNEEEIKTIQDLFLQLEVDNVSEEGNTTPLASFYSDLVNTWGHITSTTRTGN